MRVLEGQLCLLFFLLSPFHFLVQSALEVNDEVRRSQFPDGFLFGKGSSSYRIEGACFEDGKGLSNWDVYSHTPGKIRNNENGDIADDHYHRYLENIELMHSLGVNAYRFSISWARILPRGIFGDINTNGIMFYKKIIGNLLRKELRRQEKYWATINQPNMVAEMAYLKGRYPPGHSSQPFGNCQAGNSDFEPLIAMHNMILSHAMAVDLYRKHFQAKQGGTIGIVTVAFMYEPLRDGECDREAVNRALAFHVGWLLDPLVFGDYLAEMRSILGNQLPRFSPKEKRLIKGSLDFTGINHYSTFSVKDFISSACSLGVDHPIQGFPEETGTRDCIPIGDLTGKPRFFVVPRGMEKIVDYIKIRYHNMPMFITENGYSLPPSKKDFDDLIQDFDRIKFHIDYLAAMLKAIRNGADVRGYFIWSLMDNFQWNDGYDTIFGLYYVDRQTLQTNPQAFCQMVYKFPQRNWPLISKKSPSNILLLRNASIIFLLFELKNRYYAEA